MQADATPVLDLRSNAREPGIELAAGTLLYSLVPRDDIGSSGPYFTEPGRALYWGFHAMMAARKSLPLNMFQAPQNLVDRKPGAIALGWSFPDQEMVLLEIKLDRKIIFSSHMLDSNPYSYVHYKYGSHDPLSTPVQVNLDDKNISLVVKNTCKEHSWSQPVIQRIFYYGLLAMLPSTIFKPAPANQNAPVWIAKNAQGQVNVQASMAALMGYLAEINPNTEAYHEYVVETGIRICRPAEVMQERSYFVVKWEIVWLTFIAFLAVGTLSSAIKVHFINNIMSMIEPVRIRHQDTFGQFDRLVLARIISWCPKICDALALCSVNRRLREQICPLPLVQQILRTKFMPRMNNFFAVLPMRESLAREDLLGIPAKSCGHRWWKTGAVVFAEDLSETGEELHLGSRSTSSTGAVTIERYGDQPLSRAQLHLLARFGSEESNFQNLQLKPQEITPVIRGCNSFIATFAMLFSMTNYDTTPRGCEMSIHIHDADGNIDLVSKVMASMPFGTARNSNNPLELLAARPTASYQEAVRRIGSCGSWLHDIGTPYFFLDPSFSTHLEKAKAFELQRYEITAFLFDPVKKRHLTGAHLEMAKMFLTNDLLLFKDSNVEVMGATTPLVALMRCSMRGGFQQMEKRGIQQYNIDVTTEDHILLFFGALSSETIVKLSDPAIHEVYRAGHMNVYEYAVFDVDIHTSRARSHVDGVYVNDLFGTNVVGIEIGIRKNNTVDNRYYAAYMTMCCIIRIILRDGANRVQWRTNF